MATARSLHTATLLPDGRVLIAGGSGGGNSVLSSAELYDPSTGTFAPAGNMITAQAWHTAVLLGNGKVLIVGGYGTASYPNIVPPELYDPATGKFAGTGAYASTGNGGGDLYLPAILLADGKVLFAGQDQAQVYDPAGTFSLTGSASPCLSNAALLPNGKVLFAGGECFIREATATLYDPITKAFTMTGKMAAPRAWHTLTRLPSGMVLAAGGETDGCTGNFCVFAGSSATAELYDPSTGAFTSTGSMAVSRETHTATLLKDGRVLIAGGTSYGGIGIFNGTTASAELYTPACSANGGAICPAEPWQQAIATLKTAAGSNSLNFWQWAWYWQRSPTFAGAPAGFGVLGSIDNTPGAIANIIAAGGGNGLAAVSAEQWVLYYRSSSTVVSGIVNAASHLAGAIAPGELVVVTGSGLGPAQFVLAAPDSQGLYAAQLAGTTVLVNGTPVPVIYTSATQVEAVVPDSIAGGTAQVTVTYQGQTSASFPVAVAPAAPGIFTVDSTGQGHAESFNQNGLINIPAHWQGDVITLFATGLGQGAAGVTIHGDFLPVMPLSVDKGTFPGVTQIRMQIPFGQDCDTSVVVKVGDATSQPGVSIAIDLCI